MAVYWRDGEDWQAYLQRVAVPEDAEELIQQIKEKMTVDTDSQAAEISELLSAGLAGLQSAFDMAMGKVLWKLQMQQETLQEVLKEVRESEFEREAVVFRQRAREAYINGWYEEALRDFLEAEKQNYRDFSVLRGIGNIYLYEKIDYDKALEYFEKCARYAESYSKQHAAEALLFAGWIYYLQRDDATAIARTQYAFQMNPHLTEAYYNHAKFTAASGNADLSTNSLETAILVDPHYWNKAETDRDFDAIQSDLQGSYKRLCDKVRSDVSDILDIHQVSDEYYIKPCPETKPLAEELKETTKQFDQATTYFDYLALLPKVKRCRERFNRLRGYAKVAVLGGHENRLRSISFSPDGKLLASASSQNIRLWDMMSKKEIGQLRGHTKDVTAIAFSPDGEILASGSGDQTILLWNTTTQQQIERLKGHTDWITSIAFNPSGRMLASSSEDSTIRLWDVVTKWQIAQLMRPQVIPREQDLRFWDTDSVFSVVFSPDGKLLASGARDKTVWLWDVENKRLVASLEGHTNWINSVSFSPVENILASGGRDNTVRLWDVDKKQQIAQIEGHTNWITSVTFSPDGRLLASASEDNTIRLWDVETKQQVAELSGHQAWVTTVAFSPDGWFLASGSGDKTVRIWGINLVITKAEKEVRDRLWAEIQNQRKEDAEHHRHEIQESTQKLLANVRQSLEQTIEMGGEKYTPTELESTRELLTQADSAFAQAEFENAKHLVARAQFTIESTKGLVRNRVKEEQLRRIREERRRNKQCVVCGKKLGFFERRGGYDTCKTHR
jgi:WD40 repeat protein